MCSTKKYVLDINNNLICLENIFNKYIPDLPGLRFVPERRYPVSRVKSGVYKSTPYYPYKCVRYFVDKLLCNHYENSIYRDMFCKNMLLDNGNGVAFYQSHPEDILERYISSEVITDEDYCCIDNTIMDIIDTVSKITNEYDDRLIGFDVESKYVILIIGLGISTYRYIEKLIENEYDITTLDSEIHKAYVDTELNFSNYAVM